MRPDSTCRPSRCRRGLPWALLTGLLLAACTWPPSGDESSTGVEDLAPDPTVVPAGATVVTLSFADTLKSQMRAAPLLAKYGMHGTWYVSSGRIGYRTINLTLADVRALAAAGHEVGGHTLEHEDLETLPPAEVRHQLCDDRVALMELGFPVTSFAYPFGSDTTEVRQILIDCNYNNGRVTGRIRNPTGCGSCPLAETIPPPDPFRIRAVTSIESSWSVADLQSLVLQAEGSGGGWIMITLHEICDGCATYSLSEAKLDAFLAWLAPRSARGTLVMTTHEIIGGPLKPPIRSDGGIADAGVFDAGTSDAGVPDAGTPDAGTPDAGTPDAGTPDAGTPVVIPLPNPSLETDSDGDNVPDCWKRQNLGSTSGGWSRTEEAHTGSWAQRPRISSASSGDRRLVVTQDSGACARAAAPGRSYRVSAWYKTDSRAAFVASYRTASGTWVTWTAGPDLPPSATTYVRGEWVTPPLPAGATHLSVGLALRGVGFAVMDDFALEVLPGP